MKRTIALHNSGNFASGVYSRIFKRNNQLIAMGNYADFNKSTDNLAVLSSRAFIKRI